VEGKKSQQEAKDAQRTRDNRAGNVELEVDEQGSDYKQQDGNIGVCQPCKKPFACRRRQIFNVRVMQMQRNRGSVEACDRAVVELAKQCVVIGGDEVDQVELEAFIGGVGLCVDDRRGGRRTVALARDGDGAQKG